MNHRRSERYHVRWKIALIFDEHEHKPTYHGRTHDLSLSGTAMLTDVDIFTSAPVVILLAPPPLYKNHRQKIIEIQARQLYSVYSGATSCFRLGFEFTHFKSDGLKVLTDRLKHHRPKDIHKPPASN
ncbi:MAG: PilZ domain-containing protein [Sterolibacterium sp.]|jgi:hypothetical protein